jgi:hypothetical protein
MNERGSASFLMFSGSLLQRSRVFCALFKIHLEDCMLTPSNIKPHTTPHSHFSHPSGRDNVEEDEDLFCAATGSALPRRVFLSSTILATYKHQPVDSDTNNK